MFATKILQHSVLKVIAMPFSCWKLTFPAHILQPNNFLCTRKSPLGTLDVFSFQQEGNNPCLQSHLTKSVTCTCTQRNHGFIIFVIHTVQQFFHAVQLCMCFCCPQTTSRSKQYIGKNFIQIPNRSVFYLSSLLETWSRWPHTNMLLCPKSNTNLFFISFFNFFIIPNLFHRLQSNPQTQIVFYFFSTWVHRKGFIVQNNMTIKKEFYKSLGFWSDLGAVFSILALAWYSLDWSIVFDPTLISRNNTFYDKLIARYHLLKHVVKIGKNGFCVAQNRAQLRL